MSKSLPVLELCLRPGAQERRLRLAEGIHLLGSGSEADVRLQEPTVSRRHLKLQIDGGKVRLKDLDSRNGTWFEGKRLSEREFEISERLLLRLGEVELSLCPLAAADASLAVRGDPAQQLIGPLPPSAVTLGEDLLGRFARSALPQLLQLIQTGVSAEDFAHQLSLRLQQLLGAGWLRIRLDDALVASAGATQEGESCSWTGGRWSLLVDGSGDALAAHRGLFELALQLLCLSAPSTAKAAVPELSRPAGNGEPPAPGSSNRALCELYAQSAQLAQSDLAVLILGQTGTGKELFARHLHRASGLPEARWVALNCAALPDDLLEAELFGIDRGVATGVNERAGCFELADGGTLFLDEIGDMSLSTQAKILRVLQERRVYRVGSRQPRPARVRLVSATNADLEAMVDAGDFRRDLYHRLADWVVTLPSLRERAEDIANLAAHFLSREMRRLGKAFGGLSEASVSALCAYPWPGNVRELEREMMRCALILGDAEPLALTRLQRRILNANPAPATTLQGIVESAERAAIAAALAAADGNVDQAADRLGCARSTLYRRIKQLRL